MALPAAGYSAKRLAELIDDCRTAIRAELGAALQLENSVVGNFADLMMARLDEISEATQDLYDSFDERTAIGVYLDNLCSIVGVTRIEAAKSQVTLTLGTAGGVPVLVPAGSTVVAADGQEWVSTANVTIPPAATEDGTFEPPLTGAITAIAASLDVPGTASIGTPITGWDTVTQATAATPGRDRETDEELRLRRRESLQIVGSASVNAIRAALREVDGVTHARVFENATDYPTTVGGVTLPGHTYLVVVYPDPATATLRQEIAEVIWRRAPAGIASVDATGVLVTTYAATVVDVEGISQTVYFGVADPLALTCTVTVEDGSPPPVDADIKAAIIAYIDTLGMGDSPKALPVYEALGEVDGVEDVTALAFVGAPSDVEVPTLIPIAITVTHV